MSTPVCKVCNDTHWMDVGDRTWMCTGCPIPCDDCIGKGPYCAQTPCSCKCHNPNYVDPKVLTKRRADALMLLADIVPTSYQLQRLRDTAICVLEVNAKTLRQIRMAISPDTEAVLKQI